MAGKLVMLRGLPGSGKSTWAEDQYRHGLYKTKVVIVTKDDIRDELHKKDWNYDVEKEVLRIRDFRIEQALSKGFVVISADTNLAPKHETRLRELAKKYKATFEVEDFLRIPLNECIKRDAQREFPVGPKVIVKMAEDMLGQGCSDLFKREREPQLFCDLDGVLADFDGFIATLGIENDRTKPERPDFWDKLRAYKGRLYYDMPKLAGADELWAGIRDLNPVVLTGVPWSIPTAWFDKQEWFRDQINPFGPPVQVLGVSARNKSLFMKPGDIIIDDQIKHADRWVEKGGTWIHYTGDPVQTIKEVKEHYEV